MHRLEAMDTFVRVVANGSFAGAAEEMNVSRAIVTKRIMQLEAALGAKLLNRTTRRLSATEIGLRYRVVQLLGRGGMGASGIRRRNTRLARAER